MYLKIRITAMLNLLMIGKLKVEIWKIVKWNVVHSKSHKIRINCTAVREEYPRTWYCRKNPNYEVSDPHSSNKWEETPCSLI